MFTNYRKSQPLISQNVSGNKITVHKKGTNFMDENTWQCDVDLENTPFIRSANGARNGTDQTRKIVAFRADSDARAFNISAAFEELLLNASEVYHL